jgi:sugar lactone lactonase YvrE
MPLIRFQRLRPVLCLAVLLLTVGGCLPAPAPPVARPEISWEAIDAALTVVWLGEVRVPADLGIRPNLWGRLRSLVTGNEEFRLLRPYGLDRDAEGRLCIADPGARVVHCLDPAGNRVQTLRGTKRTPFLSPIDLARGDDGTLFITDSAAGAIYAVPPDADSARLLASLPGGRPTGIAFNSRLQLLYVADTTAHQVVAFDLAGHERLRFGTRGAGEGVFNYPTDLAIDAEERILVTDSLNARVQIFSAEGGYLGQFGAPGREAGEFGKPKGVAVTRDGYRAVCDAELDRIQIFAPDGRPVLLLGQSGAGPGDFQLPTGLFVDDDNVLWIADSYNQRVQYVRIVAGRSFP